MKPYHKGQKARRKGKSLDQNPYLGIRHKVSQKEWWSKGWRDEDAIIEALSPESGWKSEGHSHVR